MSKEGGSGAAGSPEAGGVPNDPAKDALFEARGPKTIVRVITVLAYMFSVSFVAIVLSAYYLFLWEPPNPRLLHSASRREGPRVHYLRADPPHLKIHGHGNLENDLFNGSLDQDEAGHKLGSYKDSEDFYENLVSLRSTLNDVLRERSNDSSVNRNLTEHVTNDLSSSNRAKIEDKRTRALNDDNANVRKDTQQEAKFISGDKSGINDNTTWTLPYKREKKDGFEDSTTTIQQVSEYIVKRHRFLWNTTSGELIRKNDKSNYDHSREGREDEKKNTKTTGKSPSILPCCRTSTTVSKTID